MERIDTLLLFCALQSKQVMIMFGCFWALFLYSISVKFYSIFKTLFLPSDTGEFKHPHFSLCSTFSLPISSCKELFVTLFLSSFYLPLGCHVFLFENAFFFFCSLNINYNKCKLFTIYTLSFYE